jgi:hypothetical protein
MSIRLANWPSRVAEKHELSCALENWITTSWSFFPGLPMLDQAILRDINARLFANLRWVHPGFRSSGDAISGEQT